MYIYAGRDKVINNFARPRTGASSISGRLQPPPRAARARASESEVASVYFFAPHIYIYSCAARLLFPRSVCMSVCLRVCVCVYSLRLDSGSIIVLRAGGLHTLLDRCEIFLDGRQLCSRIFLSRVYYTRVLLYIISASSIYCTFSLLVYYT